MSDFPQKVENYIIINHLIPAGSTVIAGVSGGADSLALLLILAELQTKIEYQLIVAHLNHNLRGADANRDAQFVQEWCAKLDLKFILRSCDIAQAANKAKIGLELAGRNTRRQFFGDIIADLQQKQALKQEIRVALAHHRNDQAESLLLHLGRGSGLDGLAGMRPQSGIYIRPLLECSRQEIEDWLRLANISWRTDESNNLPVTTRNRLRHVVLPAWQEAIGYDPVPALARAARALREDSDYLHSLAEREYKNIKSKNGLPTEKLRLLKPAMFSRVLRFYWAEKTGSFSDLTMTHIDSLRKICSGGATGKQIMLPHKWTAVVEEKFLCLQIGAETRQTNQPADKLNSILLHLPGLTVIEAMNLQITANLIENESEIVYNNAMECFWLEEIRGSRMRYRLPGDRIHPAGRKCGKSLKKYFHELKIPPFEREKILLLARGNEVVWIPGIVAGQGVARQGDNREGPLVCLKISRLSPE